MTTFGAIKRAAGVAGAIVAIGGGGVSATRLAAAEPEAAAPPPAWFLEIGKRLENKREPMLPPGFKPRQPGQEFGGAKFPWSGVQAVWDPVNREALLLGGHYGGMPFGTLGNWALAEDGTTWRELKYASPTLDPLREKALAARTPAKNGEAAARSIFYAAMEPAKEAEAVKAKPAKLLGEAVRLAGDLDAALAASKPEGWEKVAVAHARTLAGKAAADLKAAAHGFAAGTLSAALLKNCFDAQWALDEAADCLATAPGPRELSSAAYDPENRCIVLFGGNHQDYMTSDTWIYDCAKKIWRQVWSQTAPSPRMKADFKFDDGRKLLALAGGQAMLNRVVPQRGYMPAPAGEWTFNPRTGEWNGQDGAPGGSRVYRALAQAHNPCWYDAAPRGDPAATARWLEALAPNTWTEVPRPPAMVAARDWGTARLDPDRDQIYWWTGGHEADPSTAVSTYHPGINRWHQPFVPDVVGSGFGKGMSFAGRPDCANHTYLAYAYDPVSKRLICTSEGGTGVYNPDSGDFEFSVDQPFRYWQFQVISVGTPRGVVVWDRSLGIWLFDYKERTWKKLPVVGKQKYPESDGGTLAYDSKRDVLWMASFAGYEKPSGDIWRYDMKSGQIQAMHPANADSIGKARGMDKAIRESAYLPKLDLLLLNNFVAGQEVAYDPEKNRWVLLANVHPTPPASKQGYVHDTLNYDARRDLVWNINVWRTLVLKLDPKTLEISENPVPPAKKE